MGRKPVAPGKYLMIYYKRSGYDIVGTLINPFEVDLDSLCFMLYRENPKNPAGSAQILLESNVKAWATTGYRTTTELLPDAVMRDHYNVASVWVTFEEAIARIVRNRFISDDARMRLIRNLKESHNGQKA